MQRRDFWELCPQARGIEVKPLRLASDDPPPMRRCPECRGQGKVTQGDVLTVRTGLKPLAIRGGVIPCPKCKGKKYV